MIGSLAVEWQQQWHQQSLGTCNHRLSRGHTKNLSRVCTAFADKTSRYVVLGRPEGIKNYMSNASVYDPYDGSWLFRVLGLRYHRLDAQEGLYIVDRYSKATWKLDIIFLSQKALFKSAKTLKIDQGHVTNKLINVEAHKNPNLTAVKVNMLPDDSTSTWLPEDIPDSSIRAFAA